MEDPSRAHDARAGHAHRMHTPPRPASPCRVVLVGGDGARIARGQPPSRRELLRTVGLAPNWGVHQGGTTDSSRGQSGCSDKLKALCLSVWRALPWVGRRGGAPRCDCGMPKSARFSFRDGSRRGAAASARFLPLACNRLLVGFSVVVALAVGALERDRRLQVRTGGCSREGGFFRGDSDEPGLCFELADSGAHCRAGRCACLFNIYNLGSYWY